MLFGNYNEEYKYCVLKCKNGKHFFRIPTNTKTRKIWLDKLGLQSVNVNSRVCNNHFSDQMFTMSGKRLTKTAIPDRNIPAMNGNVEHDEDASSQLENMIEHLLSRDDISSDSFDPKNLEPKKDFVIGNTTIKMLENGTSKSNNIRKMGEPITNCTPSNGVNSEEFPDDTRKVLMNYQLRKQGKPVCDVVELPQFILVFTAFRAKDTFIIPPNDLTPEYMQDHNDEEKTKSKRKQKKNREAPIFIKSGQSDREIKYVHYKPQTNVVRREREMQADMSANITTTEIAVQCDLEEEPEADRDTSSEFEWINHLIKAHVFNAEGNMYECQICGEIATSYASNLKHSLIHKETSSLCFQCGLQFSNHVKLKIHEKRAHLKRKLEIKKALRCPKFHCTKAFHSRRLLYDHIDQHTKKTEYSCKKCQRSFFSYLQIHRHKLLNNCWR